MTRDDLRLLVNEVRQHQRELDNVEVKKAQHGTPKRLHEPLSAFANRTGGGLILFGVDEEKDFTLSGVGDVQKLQEEITNTAAHEMDPPLRPRFTVDEIDGKAVVAVEIDEVAAAKKPCFYKSAGLPKGAWIRVGNTNRQMTEYEVFGFLSSRSQPLFDEEIVSSASHEDLDPGLFNDYLEKLRRSRPRAGYLGGESEEALLRLHVLARDGAIARPTLAGLLAFGKYPQEFFPQLMITFVQYYGTTEEEKTPRGERFLDNQRFEGPIPRMIDEAETHILGTMRKAALIEGLLRRDVPEYPNEALREAIANAVAHRDYSSYTRGKYIRIRMFADRLEIQSPGGLFGTVTMENIEEEHSTRNARLMRMMEDLHVVENRGSGIRAMLQAMREANLEPPRFDDRRSSFDVTFRNHTLMSPEAVSWLNRFSSLPINDRQRLALVYLRLHERVGNADYRRLNRVDAATAGAELRGLVQESLAAQEGVGRWTTYTLKAPSEIPELFQPRSEEEKILAFVREKCSIRNVECQELLGVSNSRAYYLLKKMLGGKLLVARGVGKGRRYWIP